MSHNSNLHTARKKGNDEFYTRLIDIEKELTNYKEYFRDKVVYCNCDDPKHSKFITYFTTNFHLLGLRKLIATFYAPTQYDCTHITETPIKWVYDGTNTTKTKLSGNGSFASKECLDILSDVDVVVTNPPFSLFRDFVDILVTYNKDFLIIGNQNAITYKEIFPFIKEGTIKLGINNVKQFVCPTDYVNVNDNKNIKYDSELECNIAIFGNIGWFTTLTTKKQNKEITLTKSFNPIDYPLYDNCNAINIRRVKDIPKDYYGKMGVPAITFIKNYNPKQFEIVGYRKGDDGKDLKLNGKYVYTRILIERIR